jgi:hypothetical protein
VTVFSICHQIDSAVLTIRNKVFNLQFPSLFRDIYVRENAGVICDGFEIGAAVAGRSISGAVLGAGMA